MGYTLARGTYKSTNAKVAWIVNNVMEEEFRARWDREFQDLI